MLSFPKDAMYSKAGGAKEREIGKCTISNLASFPFKVPVHLPLEPTTLCAILLQETALQDCLAELPAFPSLPLVPSVLLSWLAYKRTPQMGFSCLPHKWHMSVKAGGRPWPGTLPEGQPPPPALTPLG